MHAVGGGATAATPPPVTEAAVFAEGGPGTGVYATSDRSNSTAVNAAGTNGADWGHRRPVTPASASSASVAVAGGIGVSGLSGPGTGVSGVSDTGNGVSGISDSGTGVSAKAAAGSACTRSAGGATATTLSPGSVSGGLCRERSRRRRLRHSDGGIGVLGASTAGIGVSGPNRERTGLAGQFMGPVRSSMVALTKSGGGFKIDHPLDPANRYLYHSFVESSEMKNVYDGVVALDPAGQVEVELPAWFEAVNRDFRYQLTPIGAPAPGLHIARKVSDGRFAIAGGQPGLEVSWQVTGVRKDAWAQANPLEVEKEKPRDEQGFYIHPELHGEPEEKGMAWAQHPDIMRRLQESQQNRRMCKDLASIFMTVGQLPS